MNDFYILPCSMCKKTPTVIKNSDKFNEERYTLSHCGVVANAITETQVIVNWNKLQEEDNNVGYEDENK